MPDSKKALGILFGVKGGSSIDKDSGALILQDLKKIVNQINNNNKLLPKIQLQLDVNKSIKNVSKLQQSLAGLDKQAKNIQLPSGGPGGSRGGGNRAGDAKSTAENYRKLTASIKEYYAALADIGKIQMKNSGVKKGDDGVWTTTDKQYEERIKRINRLKKELAGLGITFIENNEVQFDSAQKLGVSEQQRELLIKKSANALNSYTITTEKNSSRIQEAWKKNTDNVHEYIQRKREVASKNQDVKKMMDELDKLAASGDPKDLDELLKRFRELQQKIRETGADVETWGDKFKKTFAGKVRSALAAAITGSFTKYLRDVYLNVVNIDKAMTDLQIASGKSREEVKKLTKSYADLARQLGATTIEIAQAADTWLRQGYTTQEANALIRNSAMLAKLGQMESADASTSLTSAMKGYNVTVEESISIVDKFTAVDMVAAASAGDLATAMAETATGARIAGVSMDTLIGYIATVKEVTQDSAESVGTFYRTLFARMNNVAAGNFVDEETGESLNDVETVLNQLGISLRNTNGLFRDSGEVLDDVANRWFSFNNVQQHAIATAFAGTRQQEKFIALMENYGSAVEYAKTSLNSAGTAQEKYGAYTESVAGKLASLTATFEQLSMNVLNSDWVVTGIEMLTGLVSVLNGIVSAGDGVVVAIVAFGAACLSLVVGSDLAKKSLTRLILEHAKLQGVQVGTTVTTEAFVGALKHMSSTGLLGVITLIPRLIVGLISLVAQFGFAEVAALGLKGALELLNINPIMLAITALVAAIAGAVAGFKAYSKHLKDVAKQEQAVLDSTIALNKRLKEEKETLDDLIDSYHELAESSKGVYDASEREEILRIQEQIVDLVGKEASSLDLVNAEYRDLAGTLRELYSFSLDKALRSKGAIQENVSIVKEEVQSLMSKEFANGFILSQNPVFNTSGDSANNFGFVPTGNAGGTRLETEDVNEYIQTLKSAKDYMDSLRNEWEGDRSSHLLYGEITWRIQEMEKYIPRFEENVDALLDSILAVTDYSIKAGEAIGGINLEGSGLEDGVIDNIDEYAKLKDVLLEVATASEEVSVSQEQILESVENFMQSIYGDVYAELAANIYKSSYQLKGFSKIAEETSSNWDALTEAMSDMDERGILSLDSYQKLLETIPDIEGLKLTSGDGTEINFLEQTASGYYKLNGTIEDFIKLKQEELISIMASNREGSPVYENAKEDLESLIAVYNTMSLDKEIEDATARLKSQMDQFEDLIDLRKELLDTYKEEISYQNELRRKQRAVTDAQTKLSVARLDASAAGQARVRELEQELQDAQNELDDFTLEHAIDVLSTQLESENQEYKALIQAELDHLKTTADQTTDIANMLKELKDFFDKDAEKKAEADRNRAYNDLQDYITANGLTASGNKSEDAEYQRLLSNAKANGVAGTSAGVEAMMTWHNTKPEDDSEETPEGYVYIDSAGKSGKNKIRDTKGNNFAIVVNGTPYKVESNGKKLSSEQAKGAETTVKNGGGVVQEGALITIDGTPYVYTYDGNWVGVQGRGWQGAGQEFENMKKVLRQYNEYHTGGFVGDGSALSSNEEFAKLLKGEFVSTPAQMKRFMEDTLPKIANYSATGSSNEFNAPLIEITCESVTTESMPRLERVVSDAVKEIQKQLDSGMSRTGFKRQTKKRLT